MARNDAPKLPFPPPSPKGPDGLLASQLAVSRAKVSLGAVPLLVRAVLAGAFIALGAAAMLLVKADTTLSFAVSQWLGGLVFSLGLVLVLAAGAELFTGNSLIVMGVWAGRVSWAELARNWALVLVGNLLGAILMVGLLLLADFPSTDQGQLGQAAARLALSKTQLPWTVVLVRAILCNVLVCLAVWMAHGATSVTDKVLCCLVPVAAFVALGFEHSVANLFLLPLGMACGPQALAAGAVDGLVTWAGVAQNLSAALIGNVIGGALLVGGAYWLGWGRGARGR